MLSAFTASAQTLVVYYSRTGQNYTPDGIVNLKVGNTQVIARLLARSKEAIRPFIFRLHNMAKNQYLDAAFPARKSSS